MEKKIFVTKVVNYLKKNHAELDLKYDLLPQCGIELDPETTGCQITKKMVDTFVKSLKGLPLLLPFKEAAESIPPTKYYSKKNESKKAKAAAEKIVEEKLVEAPKKKSVKKLSKEKKSVKTITKAPLLGNKKFKLANKCRKLNWLNIVNWLPFERSKDKVYVNCFCQKEAVPVESQFGDKSTFYTCGNLSRKCQMQLTEVGVRILLDLMSSHNLKFIPRPACSCETPKDNHVVLKGSMPTVQEPKIWYKCPVCSASFYFDNIMEKLKSVVAKNMQSMQEEFESEDESGDEEEEEEPMSEEDDGSDDEEETSETNEN